VPGTLIAMARGSLRELGWWLTGAGRLWWRHKLRGSLHVLLTLLAWLERWELVLAMLIAPVVMAAWWARLGPVSYARRVTRPLTGRRLRRHLRRAWPTIMDSVGLARRAPVNGRRVPIPGQAVSPPDRVQAPQVKRIRWVDGQLVAWPRLLTGQTVDDVEAVADRLRVAAGAQRCRVVPNASLTACRIVWSFGDLLAEPFDTIIPAADAPVSDLRSAVLGRTEDGLPWLLPLGMSTLTAGSSGSGKASLIWGLVFRLGPSVKIGLVQLHGIDLKGGMELAMGRPLFTRYAQTADHAVILLEDAARDLQARAARLAGQTRHHRPSLDEPLVVVVIDELAALIAYQPDRDLTRRAEAALSVVLSQGRAVGFVVFAFLQDPRKETVKMRHLFTQAIGLRLRDREEVAMVLGDGAAQAGALCHKIPHTTPGVGYVLGEDNRPVRVRAGYVSDPMIRAAAGRFAAPRLIPIEIPEPEPASPRARSPRTPRAPRSGQTTEGDAS
jgi:S-DNA-T family DNA segregation ATPase FtsK/SpoIIIE